MKKINLLFLALFSLILSCTKDSIDENFKNAFDCEFDSNPNFIGICLNGSTLALKNEVLTYASKSTSNFSEISWEIESGNMEILNIDASVENGVNKSIATIQFNSDFNGGSIRVFTIDSNSNAFAEISNYAITLETQ
ncbi:hypothetical protein [uncultured Winogradskyella sp.]|uniref:hypothetical protein n=1 Tax=uncultured Winogradskyella sp. TaxID=395353 RepID=UPI002601782F|nr:hypothetical protein [uncultured Winogradskyella sp.]